MARTRQQEPGADWSCPLCTLLNKAEDGRCAACDNARPPAQQQRKNEVVDPSTAVATASNVQHVYRPAVGVFFSSSVGLQGSPGGPTAWRQEPRLTVNRRRGNRGPRADLERTNKQECEKSEIGVPEQVTAPTERLSAAEETQKALVYEERSADAVDGRDEDEKHMQEQEEEDTAVDVEEPCFNLLGSGMLVFGAPTTEDAVEDPCTTDEAKSREESEEADPDEDAVVASSPPRYPGFMPASKVPIEEPIIEDKLASAGLDLSDSDDEEEKPKVLRQRKEEENAWEDKWVCQICTNLNNQTALECTSCMVKRFRDTLRSPDIDTESSLKWACHICTNLNSSELTECEACMTNRRGDTRLLNSSLDGRWTCSVCTKVNAPGTIQCELCDTKHEDKAKKGSGKGRECPICTNMNPPGRTRCELCDSPLQSENQENYFVDLSSSPVRPPPRKSSYTFDDNELENPYADLSQLDYAAANEVADPDTDFVEEISDNEAAMSFNNSRPANVRADLKELKQFVCMEDLRGDYGCRINYNKMFAGQRSHKSYADRAAARQAESRKRKRQAARLESGEIPAPASRGGKAARGSKKRKTAAAPRRASSGTKTTKSKRTKKKATSVRRASSATAYASGINHYDDTAATLLLGYATNPKWKIVETQATSSYII